MSNDSLFQSAYLNFQRGQMNAAVAECRALLATDPRHLNGLQLLAHLFFARGALNEAAELLQRASALQPSNATILGNLGAVYCAAGRFVDAVNPLREAIRSDPNRFDAWRNLGRALQHTQQLADSTIAYQNALTLNPSHAEALGELAAVYSLMGRIDDAIATLQRMLDINPQLPDTLHNLAATQHEAGRLDEAIALYRRSLAIRANDQAHANLIMALHLVDDDLASAKLEIQRWNDLYVQPLRCSVIQFQNDQSPDRRLRLGYVSRDFNISPVGRFIAPILSHHNHQLFEVYAYATVIDDDRLVLRNKQSVDHWQLINGMSDDALAQKIREDQIDVLIDLGMHTTASRLFVFARKPAPVQLSYLAYAGSTGLAEIDGEISDGFLNPTGGMNVTSFWCYEAPIEAPDVSHHRGGPITFGCLNNFCKVTPATRAAWIDILNRVPDARLIIHALPGSHRNAFPIDPTRVTFVDRLSPADYFAMYNAIDIALDPFPYPGGTTTCDALWMVTPVISVAGKTPVSRAGLSIMSNVGVPELVASTRSQYVELAVALAKDRDRLDAYHRTLRSQMQRSPLMDAARATRELEGVYRNLWQQFCSRGHL